MTRLDQNTSSLVASLPPKDVMAAMLDNGRWIEFRNEGVEKLCVTVNSMGSPTLVTLGSVDITHRKKEKQQLKEAIVKNAMRRDD